MRMRKWMWRAVLALGLVAGLLADVAWAARPDPVSFGAAVEQGDLAGVKAWLDAGLEPDFMADRIGSGLMVAAWEGNVAMMELFLSHGARIDLANRYDEQALQLAAWRGQRPAVEWLLAHGATANRAGARWSALHYAVFAGHPDIAQLLIERGAEVNARAPNGSTPLMMAAREGREKLARQLLDAGADPTATNESGESALLWAMRHEHFGIARMVSSAAEFAKAAQAAPESFGPAVRSQPAPPEIEEILRQIRFAQMAERPVAELRRKLFEAVARFRKDSQREIVGKKSPVKAAKRISRGKPTALVITARRGQGKGAERAELVYAPKEVPLGDGDLPLPPTEVPAILERIARERAAGRSTEVLRKALFEAVARFKKGASDSRD